MVDGRTQSGLAVEEGAVVQQPAPITLREIFESAGLQTPEQGDDRLAALCQLVRKTVGGAVEERRGEDPFDGQGGRERSSFSSDLGPEEIKARLSTDLQLMENFGHWTLSSEREFEDFVKNGVLSEKLVRNPRFMKLLSEAVEEAMEAVRPILSEMAPEMGGERTTPADVVNHVEFAVMSTFNGGPETEAGKAFLARRLQQLDVGEVQKYLEGLIGKVEDASFGVRLGVAGVGVGIPLAIDMARGVELTSAMILAVLAAAVFAPFQKAWQEYDVSEKWNAFALSNGVPFNLLMLLGTYLGGAVNTGNTEPGISASLIVSGSSIGAALIGFLKSRVASRAAVNDDFQSAGNWPSSVTNLIAKLKITLREHNVAELIQRVLMSFGTKEERLDMLKVAFIEVGQTLEKAGVKAGPHIAEAFADAKRLVEQGRPDDFKAEDAPDAGGKKKFF